MVTGGHIWPHLVTMVTGGYIGHRWSHVVTSHKNSFIEEDLKLSAPMPALLTTQQVKSGVKLRRKQETKSALLKIYTKVARWP